jgi:hypothetical protein
MAAASDIETMYRRARAHAPWSLAPERACARGQAVLDGHAAWTRGRSPENNPHDPIDAPDLADAWACGFAVAREAFQRRCPDAGRRFCDKQHDSTEAAS